jgi:mRNA interferase YafQ
MMATEPEPLVVVMTTRYNKDAELLRKRGKKMTRLVEIVDALRNRRRLAERHRDHALSGDRQGWRDCHIEPDWSLIYRVDEEAGTLILGRTGTHADLF